MCLERMCGTPPKTSEKKANSAAEKNSGDDEKHLQKLHLSASKHDDEDDAK